MYDIGSFYEAASVEDAIRKLQEWPDAEIISGGSDVLIKIREGKLAGRSLVSIHNIAVLKGGRWHLGHGPCTDADCERE